MSRIGGAFPFPISESAQGGGFISLPSGGIFQPPSGEYIFTSGGQTALETWDPIQGQWGAGLPPVQVRQYFNTDGFNYRLINKSGIIQGAKITSAGSGGTNGIGFAATGVAVTFTSPGVTGAQTAIGYAIVGGAVQAPTVNQAGSGFTVAPLVVIDPPPQGGIQATAHATLNSSGGVASITMDNPGAGYPSVPGFYLIPQSAGYQGASTPGAAAATYPTPGQVNIGSSVGQSSTNGLAFSGAQGALLNPASLTGSGTLTGIGMQSYGSFYTGTTIPTVSITGMTVNATAVAIPSFAVQSVTLNSGGAGYGTTSAVWESSLALVSNTFNNNVLVPLEASGLGLLTGGAVSSFTVEYAGYGIQGVPLLSIGESGSSLATVGAVGTAVVGGITDISTLQAKVQ